ncbi:MAG: hypothetical protein JRJ23_10970 [Deltaproteobacteria bacterium]|nr:hypothetical protein [Deltaproteobacteria bacterium]
MDKSISSLYFKLFSCVILVLALAFYNKLAHSAEVTLQWNSVPEAEGYNIYCGSDPRHYLPPQNAENHTSYTVSLDPGTYYFAVTAYNNYGESGYSQEVSTTITATNPPTSVSLSSDLPSPQPEGTTVTFTAQADGGSGIYEYRFFLKDPLDQWSVVREYSSEPNYIWTATSNGESAIQVWARNAASDASYQVLNTIPFRVDSVLSVTELSASVMHVAEIIISTKKRGANVNAKANVIVRDNSDTLVEGAIVYGSWSGLTSDSDSSVTDSDGIVLFESDRMKKPSGIFTFTVDNITKDGWTYDSALAQK